MTSSPDQTELSAVEVVEESKAVESVGRRIFRRGENVFPLEDFEIMRSDGSWICKECGILNHASNERCVACFSLPQIRKFTLPRTGKVIRISSGKLVMDHSDEIPAELDEGQVLIKLAYVMICKEDINLMSSKLEYTPGQYVTGTIVNCGDKVTRPRIGQHVLIQRREKIPDSVALFGSGQGTTAGGCREYLVRRSHEVLVLPKNVSLKDGCLLPSLNNASSAVSRMISMKTMGKILKQDTILVMGCQSLGLFAIALLAPLIEKAGGHLYACDMDPNKEAKALEFGATKFIAATSIKALKSRVAELLEPPPPPAEIIAVNNDNNNESKPSTRKARKLNCILDTTGMSKLITESANMIGPGGLIVLASSLTSGEMSVDLTEFYAKRVTITASKPYVQLHSRVKALKQMSIPLSRAVDAKYDFSEYIKAFKAAVNDEVLIDIQGMND